jgi:phage-related baseplate assembly protein
LATATKIAFVNTDPDAVVTELVNYYQTLTGKILQPAQIEQLVMNAGGYRISLLLNQINETANQCLVKFATGAALEQLGALVGVTRLPASAAACVVRFNLVDGHGALTMDAGLRVQSTDGQAIFITTESKIVAAEDTYVDVKCDCTKTGDSGNGYAAGNISIILDPRPYVTSAANLDTTGGGNDDETDEEMRERILLAPSQFSVAGPKGAYEFWAKSAHPSIVDVAVTIGHDDEDDIIPGQVDIFPLLYNNAELTTEISDAVYAKCNDEKIRPLTDTVVVKSPTAVNYTVVANITILDTAASPDVQAAVTAALEAYRDARKNKLGIDVVLSQLTAVCQVAGVYKSSFTQPSADIVVDENEFTNCTAITVNIIGTHDE